MQTIHTYEELQYKVIQWACARRIIMNSTDTSQLLKAVAEMGELVDAHAKKDEAGVIDGLGDVLVCLINYAAIRRLNLIDCLAIAYNQIKDRKGYLTPEGTFVKDEENKIQSPSMALESTEEFLRYRKLLAMSVFDLELTVRSENCLNNANIATVGKLATKTDRDLLKYRNFGKKSLNEIKEKLQQLGLSLGMKFPPGLLIEQE